MQEAAVELKSLEILETRIQRAVELLKKLRSENASLRAELDGMHATAAEAATRTKELDAARLTSQQLERELKSLKDERQAVASRVDSLLKDLDALSLD